MNNDYQYDVRELLDYIEPGELVYQDWVAVGMALKDAGYTCDIWDEWSRRDGARYHAGETFHKWSSFQGAPTPVTMGTIVQMAKDRGWNPLSGGHELDWNDVIGGKDTGVIIERGWVESVEVKEPDDDWDPAGQLIKYLDTLFSDDENVGYVTEVWEKDCKLVPTSGYWDRTSGQLKDALRRCKGDLGAALGDINPNAGAWIRFNPLDGKGVKNENVTDLRYALVESDETDIDQQNALMRELELPIAALVHSGKKSLHAIVRIDAPDYSEYRKRVEYLYDVCRKNGLKPDKQNKNPSRLSRMPGVVRNGRKQFLVATNIGKANWQEWREWIESVNDDLPDIQNISEIKDNRPPLAPELIKGVLRKGHKMLLAGASKASKSFALIELAIAIAEGQPWLGFQCARGRVLYVNLELDTNSCWNRILDVYEALGLSISDNIDVWPLRGKACPMDKLAPKLIRRASKRNYDAIIIDPIYKVLTGDENAADQMAKFCNMFDHIAVELKCSVIYCHHHSKGNQGGKRSMDRASGSGVFARDPDALLDLIELPVSDDLRKQIVNRTVCDVCAGDLKKAGKLDEVSQDDLLNERSALEACERLISHWHDTGYPLTEKARKAAESFIALRIDGTLREFPRFPAVNIWFEYPIHKLDDTGVLADIDPESDERPFKKNLEKKKTGEEKDVIDRQQLEQAFDSLASFNNQNSVSAKELMKYLNITDIRTFNKRLQKHGGFGQTTKTEKAVIFKL